MIKTAALLLVAIFVCGLAGGCTKTPAPAEKPGKAMEVPQGLPGGPAGTAKDPIKAGKKS